VCVCVHVRCCGRVIYINILTTYHMYTTNSASAAIYLTSAISVAPVKSSVLKQVCLLHVRKAEKV